LALEINSMQRAMQRAYRYTSEKIAEAQAATT
jgi:hypothetical protein